MNLVDLVSEKLNYVFSDSKLLTQALTHKSFANENLGKGEDNQRLEFLGDAVLGLVVAEALMERLPKAAEGQLTPRRAALVNESSLAQLARQIDLGDIIRLGHGEEKNNGRDRPSILADAVEAVVGAVYLDGGYEASKTVVLGWLEPMLEQVVSGTFPDDAKTALQEVLQARNTNIPRYRIVGEEGPDHAKVFEVEITVDGKVLARGRGRSKKDAEKDAARRALSAVESL
ncbi:MAG: ribonuclease III [Deltaproteobacteria bacterium]|nr:ribonuclease III [Deltaproteobacteria bacterium]